jgi:DNA topoisomerase VI subunit A
MTWKIIRRGEVVGTVEAATKRDAQVVVAQRFGDGPWLLPTRTDEA